MTNSLCERLGIEYPIFAFTHCRDVVVAVSKAGGIGVLGVVGFTPEQMKEELDWIDAHIGDRPYGVDIVIPQKYEGMDALSAEDMEKQLWAMVPKEHIEFAEQLLANAGVPEWPDGSKTMGLMGWTDATATPLLDEALTRPKCRLIANALGTPPAEKIKQVKDSGRLIGALCGKVKQAVQHKEAGLDFVVAQGGEGGGHTGEVGSIVLWPQIVDAIGDLPMLAAGGIGNGRQIAAAMAMGAAGVWTGSLWLTVEEAHTQPAQKQSLLDASSEDTVRSRSWTGKPCRMLKNDWTAAWDRADTPDPLGMPLQGLVTSDGIRRTAVYADAGDCQKIAFNPCGQVIGQLNTIESCRQVIYRLLDEYVDAVDKAGGLLPKV
ncbi:nitronate monooxygenase [Haliea sp.]|jgi:NAD(P)H-dependent flavin oxidoreductase YrpB (nitropropane dioxygenase family)|uniref:nitronate monooxygenase n=1 Tax=Haliea TaxID=475794 RepID=UPI000C5B598D|nr:nitronate monooxygenase [Haliea sp.]MAY94098.1 monooxygenase [Haliea sp.]MBK40155.1 monooxygenase [Haliea sp.]MBP71257.1 monooxygenase [Haliea sp.]HBM84434.1 monooxygenase [Halieaceae bacterium]|tara:strand:- start:38591 stop:39718 length:1128 start_codon:yes stop_codon:yes gene_type:complete